MLAQMAGYLEAGPLCLHFMQCIYPEHTPSMTQHERSTAAAAAAAYWGPLLPLHITSSPARIQGCALFL